MASLIFYAWGEPVFVFLLIFTTYIDYLIGLAVEKHRGDRKGKAAVAAAVILNLGILGYFKYFGFFIENLNVLLHTNIAVKAVSMPIGISFYTFQVLSYVVDVYRGEVEAQKSPFKLLLFVSLFTQLVAGPIVRYKDISEQIDNRTVTADSFNSGVVRFIIGLGKKVILANTAGEIATSFMGTDYSRLSVLGAWMGIILYAFQIYFDFSGYSDMAIGLGRMFGFSFKENFNYPYISTSVTEFWRRWHISLSTFFRDYVYIPLGGNRRHQFRNLLITWFLTGFWHGASWNFILWGLYFFVLLLLEKTLLLKLFEKLPRLISRVYLILAVLVGWVFFYHTDLSRAVMYLKIMFGLKSANLYDFQSVLLFRNNLLFVLIALISCTPLARNAYSKLTSLAGEQTRSGHIIREYLRPAVNLCILLLSIIMLVGQSYNPFLYFRF